MPNSQPAARHLRDNSHLASPPLPLIKITSQSLSASQSSHFVFFWLWPASPRLLDQRSVSSIPHITCYRNESKQAYHVRMTSSLVGLARGRRSDCAVFDECTLVLFSMMGQSTYNAMNSMASLDRVHRLSAFIQVRNSVGQLLLRVDTNCLLTGYYNTPPKRLRADRTQTLIP